MLFCKTDVTQNKFLISSFILQQTISVWTVIVHLEEKNMPEITPSSPDVHVGHRSLMSDA